MAWINIQNIVYDGFSSLPNLVHGIYSCIKFLFYISYEEKWLSWKRFFCWEDYIQQSFAGAQIWIFPSKKTDGIFILFL